MCKLRGEYSPYSTLCHELTLIASLSDILAIVFGITTAILGIGQIIVTTVARRNPRHSGKRLSLTAKSFFSKSTTMSLFDWADGSRYADLEMARDLQPTHQPPTTVRHHEGIIRLLELWSRLVDSRENERMD